MPMMMYNWLVAGCWLLVAGCWPLGLLSTLNISELVCHVYGCYEKRIGAKHELRLRLR